MNEKSNNLDEVAEQEQLENVTTASILGNSRSNNDSTYSSHNENDNPAADDDVSNFDNSDISVDNDEDGDDDSDEYTYIDLAHTVSDEETGARIDKLTSELFADHSRAQLQDWLKSGQLTVNDKTVKPKYRVKAGDSIRLQAKLVEHSSDKPENIALDVVYEDDSVVVINKPVGMVVHPGAGNWTGTLVNALLYHYPEQAHLPRAGLVHRIDKNTSGLLLIGKTKAAQLDLQAQLKDKSVYRHYRCVVAGSATDLGRFRIIDEPIGRHRVQRTKMAVTSTGKTAITHIIDITALNDNYSLLDVRLETGRTHQIRVHLSHVGHPIIGDEVYGNYKQLRAGLTIEQRALIQNFQRQALHAYKLGFLHPDSRELIEVSAPLPEDIVVLIDGLKD